VGSVHIFFFQFLLSLVNSILLFVILHTVHPSFLRSFLCSRLPFSFIFFSLYDFYTATLHAHTKLAYYFYLSVTDATFETGSLKVYYNSKLRARVVIFNRDHKVFRAKCPNWKNICSVKWHYSIIIISLLQSTAGHTVSPSRSIFGYYSKTF
jgi:hypothetical protein